MIAAALLVFLFAPQQPSPCADAASCREMAEAARQQKDYESFHDLAWAAYRKGQSSDPELMLLLARAQSLSGRPGDALVMLERLAALGIATDAVTSEDFARVRALPRWPEVADKLAGRAAGSPDASAKAPVPPAKGSVPSTKDPAPGVTGASGATAPPSKPPVAAPPTKDPAPRPKDPVPSPKDPVPPPRDPVPPAKDPVPPKDPAGRGGDAKSPAVPAVAEPRSAGTEALSFTTVLTPDAFAYDGVSRRFVIADRRARRVAVVDEHTGQVATLVGEMGGLGEIRGIAIDVQRGDLWVASTNGEGPSLHRMQLISGRTLRTVRLGIDAPLVALAYVRDAGLVAADATGIVWRVRPDGKAEKLATLEYVPLGFGADARGRLYAAGGASRLARFAVGATLSRLGTIDLQEGIPPDAPFAVGGNRIYFLVSRDGGFTIRSVPLR